MKKFSLEFEVVLWGFVGVSCDKCEAAPATVVATAVLNPGVVKIRLCEACAESLGVS